MSKKVITFGEIMLRLSAPGLSRFVQAQSFDVTFGGREANVAVALANFGLNSYFVSRLPKHEIGQAAVNPGDRARRCAKRRRQTTDLRVQQSL